MKNLISYTDCIFSDYADDFESGKEYGIGDTNALRVDGASTSR